MNLAGRGVNIMTRRQPVVRFAADSAPSSSVIGIINSFSVTTQPRRGTRDTKGKRMEMSLMKPAKLTLVRPLAALVVRFVPFCGYA
jgi:hypothetical protein